MSDQVLSLPIDQILHGDCLDVLKGLPSASYDSIVTDPPYGLGTREPTIQDIVAYLLGNRLDTGGDFMGHAWDIPSVAVWRECYRVLKPGGYLMSFAGTRTLDLMSLGIRAAGFENRDTFACQFGPSILQWVHCLSDDTEILVDGEWQPYTEAREGRHTLCYDNETGTLSWQPIVKVHTYRLEGRVYHLKGVHTDQLVTSEHRCIVVRPDGTTTFQVASTLGKTARVFSIRDAESMLKQVPYTPLRGAYTNGSNATLFGGATEATVSEADYTGVVWCVTVPTGAFVSRRKGKVFLTGNSQGFPKSRNLLETDIIPEVERCLQEQGVEGPIQWRK